MNKLTTNATLSLAADIGRMSAADREATLRLFVGAVADAVAQEHTTPEVIGTMDDLIRFSRLTSDRASHRELLAIMDRDLSAALDGI